MEHVECTYNVKYINNAATDDGETELYLLCGGNYKRDNNNEKSVQCIRFVIREFNV